MIEKYSFGRMTIAGRTYTDDVKIVDGRVRPDWWRPGGHVIAAGDVQDVLEHAPDVLVVGIGASGMASVADDLRREAQGRGVDLRVHPTAEAVTVFNALRDEGANVDGAFHLTC